MAIGRIDEAPKASTGDAQRRRRAASVERMLAADAGRPSAISGATVGSAAVSAEVDASPMPWPFARAARKPMKNAKKKQSEVTTGLTALGLLAEQISTSFII